MSDYYIIFSTIDNKNSKKIAHDIVQKNLAAAVSIVPMVQTYKAWKNGMTEYLENLLIIRTTSQKLDELRQFIKENHPDENPEFVATPIEYGSPEYFMWISKNTE